ncbi:polysaccharide biosynthesis/export family protein [Bradyrhizobium sp. SYSU BS000235]|uniref:polysaccharide biosynthesis/export family protein n=1 Tax=Bradyrhizobium sp. SYSU BS000235 TaxID=3411332 RepID=UPI003C733B44
MQRCRALFACFLLALAVSGCMRTPGPAAAVPNPSLDSLAYDGTYRPRNVTVPASYAYAPQDEPYRLDAGDRLRIVVYGQEGLTNTYTVGASGSITMPLIGAVRARGLTPAELAAAVTAQLKKGYLREPYVAAEVESYRPFFILGEVTAPGQYPYVPNMTVESAVAIAGGYTPRAHRNDVQLTRTGEAGTQRATVPPGTVLKPGDTVVVTERWF